MTNEFNRILLGVSEGADRAAVFDRAVARAKRNGAERALVDVIRTPERIESSAEFLGNAAGKRPWASGTGSAKAFGDLLVAMTDRATGSEPSRRGMSS